MENNNGQLNQSENVVNIPTNEKRKRLWNEELRQWLEDYITRHPHHTTEVLSRSQYICISKRALDAYLSGRYFLPKKDGGEGHDPKTSSIENAIRLYRERVEGSPRHGYVSTFKATKLCEQMQTACDVAINENVIVVVYGRPGLGKSRCLTEYALQKMVTAPLTVLCSRNITTGYFIQKMARELKLEHRMTIPRLEEIVAEQLRRYPRPLFVDQANYLNERSLGTICHLWELARIPIVLSGTKALYDLFSNSKLTQEVRDQLSSRVAMHYLLTDLTIAEAKAIIQTAMGEKVTDEDVAQIYSITAGNYRHLDMIIPRIFHLMKLNEIELKSGKLTMRKLISIAGSRLMTDWN